MNRFKPRILVADDDGTILSLLAGRRSVGDVLVFTAVGEEVVGVLQAAQPDLVLMYVDGRKDQSLLEIRRILGAAPKVRIVVISDAADEVETQSIIKAGAWLCIPKPVDHASLERVINAQFPGTSEG